MKQGEIRFVDLGVTIGSEYQKTRPCLIVSPDDTNDNLNTVIIAPISSKVRGWPYRIEVSIDKTSGGAAIKGEIALDQLRTVDKKRLDEKKASLPDDELKKVLARLQEMFK
jgi:mRNA interferase MazF